MSKHRCWCLLLVFGVVLPLQAADWPQWQGSQRTAMSTETGLLKSWLKEGPPLAWKVGDLGGGYSTPSVAGGKIFGMSYRGEEEGLDVERAKATGPS